MKDYPRRRFDEFALSIKCRSLLSTLRRDLKLTYLVGQITFAVS